MTVPDRDCDSSFCTSAATWEIQPDGQPLESRVFSCDDDLGALCGRAIEEFGGGKVTVWAA